MISALYFSLSHRRRTDVSRPPEYARTIFMVLKAAQGCCAPFHYRLITIYCKVKIPPDFFYFLNIGSSSLGNFLQNVKKALRQISRVMHEQGSISLIIRPKVLWRQRSKTFFFIWTISAHSSTKKGSQERKGISPARVWAKRALCPFLSWAKRTALSCWAIQPWGEKTCVFSSIVLVSWGT